MTSIKNQNGFTIIEVLLFLGLTGLFMLIAFAGIGQRTDNVRLTDSIRSLEFFINGEASAIRNGVNSSPNATGKDEDTVFLGKMYRPIANGSTIESYTIRGSRLTDISGREGDHIGDLIHDSLPQVDSQGSYEVEWGLTLINSFSKANVAATGYEVAYFGFLLNPVNGLQSIIIIEANVSTLSGNPSADLIEPDHYLRDNTASPGQRILYDQDLSLHLCYADHTGRIGEVTMGESTLGPTVLSKFDDLVFDRCDE